MKPIRRWPKPASVCLAAALACSRSTGQTPGPIPLAPAPAPANSPQSTPGFPALKEGESPIDLGSALRLAGVQNPELLLARERISEAMALKQLAAAQALPNLNAGTSFDLHNGPLQQANGNILKVNRDSLYAGLGANAVGAASPSVPGIFYNLNIGSAWFGYLEAKQNVARAQAAARTADNDTLLRVCLAYTDLLQNETRLAFYRQNLAEAAELARLTAAYAKAGQGRQADADRAAVELTKREAELAQADADATAASARLVRLLSLESTVRLTPIDGAAVPAPIVPETLPVAELVAMALLQRPELSERRAEIREAMLALSGAKLLPFSPNLLLGYSNGTFGGGSNLVSQPPGFIGSDGKLQTGPRFGNFDDRSDLDAAVYLTFQNLGVGNLAMVRVAASRARQTDLRFKETLNRVRAEVVESDSRARAKLRQIDIGARAVALSTEAYSQDLTRIRGAQGLPIEVINSLRNLGRSRGEYLDAIIDYNRSQFQLYVAIGQPPAAVLARTVPDSLKNPGGPVSPSAPAPEKK